MRDSILVWLYLRVLVEFVQFATVNICNNDVKELTRLKVLRRVRSVNWSGPFSATPKKNGKAVWPRETRLHWEGLIPHYQ